MKLSILLIALFGLSFTYDSGNAKADKVQGLDVYVYSEPIQDYEVIESGKVVVTLTGSCSESVNQSIKKAAKVKADAVIINLENSRWEAIRYK